MVSVTKDQKSVEFSKYLDFIRRYEDDQTYEAIGGPPFDPNTAPTIDECKANLMIFGTKGGFIENLRSEKFWLNPQFQQIFGASDEEVEKLREIYREIKNKTVGENQPVKRKGTEKKEDIKAKIGRIKQRKLEKLKNIQSS
jgi:hypothetical protein